ncbi:MAG: hypothetical protein K5637_01830 [Lachnospiraceae bacterium]|nr:hypothetical protein [Lachnospiraceae bacterium]
MKLETIMAEGTRITKARTGTRRKGQSYDVSVTQTNSGYTIIIRNGRVKIILGSLEGGSIGIIGFGDRLYFQRGGIEDYTCKPNKKKGLPTTVYIQLRPDVALPIDTFLGDYRLKFDTECNLAYVDRTTRKNVPALLPKEEPVQMMLEVDDNAV